MGDFSFRCVEGPHRAGIFGYHSAETKGRVCMVDYDMSRWLYRVERGEVRAFKRWVQDVFPPNDGERYRVTGSFPRYTVEIAR